MDEPTSLLPKLPRESPQAFVHRIRTEVAEIEEKRDPPINNPRNQEILRYWEANRPKMLAELRHLGLPALTLATYLQAKMATAAHEYLMGGMPPTDAREQAEQEWLLMEPEDEEDADSES